MSKLSGFTLKPSKTSESKTFQETRTFSEVTLSPGSSSQKITETRTKSESSWTGHPKISESKTVSDMIGGVKTLRQSISVDGSFGTKKSQDTKFFKDLITPEDKTSSKSFSIDMPSSRKFDESKKFEQTTKIQISDGKRTEETKTKQETKTPESKKTTTTLTLSTPGSSKSAETKKIEFVGPRKTEESRTKTESTKTGSPLITEITTVTGMKGGVKTIQKTKSVEDGFSGKTFQDTKSFQDSKTPEMKTMSKSYSIDMPTTRKFDESKKFEQTTKIQISDGKRTEETKTKQETKTPESKKTTTTLTRSTPGSSKSAENKEIEFSGPKKTEETKSTETLKIQLGGKKAKNEASDPNKMEKSKSAESMKFQISGKELSGNKSAETSITNRTQVLTSSDTKKFQLGGKQKTDYKDTKTTEDTTTGKTAKLQFDGKGKLNSNQVSVSKTAEEIKPSDSMKFFGKPASGSLANETDESKSSNSLKFKIGGKSKQVSDTQKAESSDTLNIQIGGRKKIDNTKGQGLDSRKGETHALQKTDDTALSKTSKFQFERQEIVDKKSQFSVKSDDTKVQDAKRGEPHAAQKIDDAVALKTSKFQLGGKKKLDDVKSQGLDIRKEGLQNTEGTTSKTSKFQDGEKKKFDDMKSKGLDNKVAQKTDDAVVSKTSKFQFGGIKKHDEQKPVSFNKNVDTPVGKKTEETTSTKASKFQFGEKKKIDDAKSQGLDKVDSSSSQMSEDNTSSKTSKFQSVGKKKTDDAKSQGLNTKKGETSSLQNTEEIKSKTSKFQFGGKKNLDQKSLSKTTEENKSSPNTMTFQIGGKQTVDDTKSQGLDSRKGQISDALKTDEATALKTSKFQFGGKKNLDDQKSSSKTTEENKSSSNTMTFQIGGKQKVDDTKSQGLDSTKGKTPAALKTDEATVLKTSKFQFGGKKNLDQKSLSKTTEENKASSNTMTFQIGGKQKVDDTKSQGLDSTKGQTSSTLKTDEATTLKTSKFQFGGKKKNDDLKSISKTIGEIKISTDTMKFQKDSASKMDDATSLKTSKFQIGGKGKLDEAKRVSDTKNVDTPLTLITENLKSTKTSKFQIGGIKTDNKKEQISDSKIVDSIALDRSDEKKSTKTLKFQIGGNKNVDDKIGLAMDIKQTETMKFKIGSRKNQGSDSKKGSESFKFQIGDGLNQDLKTKQTTETKKDIQDGGQTVTVTEVKGGSRGGSSSSMKIKEDSTISTPKQNGVETSRSREEVRKSEQSRNMANVATAPPPVNNQQMMNDYDDEDDEDGDAVYENVPSPARTDVFRETDVKTDLELPQLGRASSMKERFLKLAGESASGKRTADKELTPPPEIKGVIEAGVFESQPSQQRQDVYRFRDTRHEDPVPEKGKALNTVQKYKEIASREFKGAADKREITPDKTGVHEYVSEPRAEHLTYEERPLEAGVFESKPLVAENVSRYEDYVHEELPEIGTAKSIASKFKEIEKNAYAPKAAANKREVTPDRHGRGEYVTEPRAQHLTYEEKVEGGVYENQPVAVSEDIYRHEEYYTPDTVPEKGTARNLVSRFREIEKNAAVPKPSGRQITPPREDTKNVFENVPTDSPIAYKETVRHEDVLPEKGKAKNLASKYKVIEQENLKAKGGDRRVKEFTPPKDERTVFESTPRDSGLRYEEAPVESGILENQPTVREDIYRESDPRDIEVELPERGAAKNLLSRWKQIESESANKTPPTPGRYKEFTPPRTDDRVKEQRPPMSPGIQNNSVQPNDLPGQYQQAGNEPSVFESTPTAPREDLYREADTDWSSGLPKANKTKKMLSRFQAIQQKAQEPVTSSTKREEPEYTIPHIKDNKPKKGGFVMAVQNEKCGACQKTVYVMEKIEMNKNNYHKGCLKCSQCSTVLTPKTFAINAGIMYCTSHYKQLFARKGNYDEGFGRPQHKKKWKSEPNLLADSELLEHEIEA